MFLNHEDNVFQIMLVIHFADLWQLETNISIQFHFCLFGDIDCPDDRF